MSADILTLMYHQILEPNNHQALELFDKHLQYIKNHFSVVLPNDQLSKDKLNICLTFDDAYCDFYAVVFPLLKKYNFKAILGVPTKYILKESQIPMTKRLNVAYPQGMDDDLYKQQVPFCTWQELKEMAHSKFVEIACHSFSHPHLAHKDINLQKEIIDAKQTIESNIETKIKYFIYPYGNCNRKVHNLVRKHYQYGFRIGSALNKGWDKKRNMLYRVDADQYWKHDLPITTKQLRKYNRKYWLNRLRIK